MLCEVFDLLRQKRCLDFRGACITFVSGKLVYNFLLAFRVKWHLYFPDNLGAKTMSLCITLESYQKFENYARVQLTNLAVEPIIPF